MYNRKYNAFFSHNQINIHLFQSIIMFGDNRYIVPNNYI